MAQTPYKIACLCELRDPDGRVLLLHRAKPPNRHLYSPIGGKLETHLGESPAHCAQREIQEEADLHIPLEHLHLLGIISETAFPQHAPDEDRTHWLMFWYRVTLPVTVTRTSFDEGSLEWFEDHEIDALPLPDTDKLAIWPAVRAHAPNGFFHLHIDCTPEPPDPITQTLIQSIPPTPTPA